MKVATTLPTTDCDDLGEVFGKSGAEDQEIAMIGARSDLKNKAALLGGNYVTIETNNSKTARNFWTQLITEILLGGRAFRCP